MVFNCTVCGKKIYSSKSNTILIHDKKDGGYISQNELCIKCYLKSLKEIKGRIKK